MHVRRRTDAYLIPGEPSISVQLITNLPSGSVAAPPGVVNSMPSPWVLCIKRDRRTTRKERLSNCMRLCICYNEQTNANANEARLGWCETTVKFRHASSSSVVGGKQHGGGGAENDRQEQGSLQNPSPACKRRRVAPTISFSCKPTSPYLSLLEAHIIPPYLVIAHPNVIQPCRRVSSTFRPPLVQHDLLRPTLRPPLRDILPSDVRDFLTLASSCKLLYSNRNDDGYWKRVTENTFGLPNVRRLIPTTTAYGRSSTAVFYRLAYINGARESLGPKEMPMLECRWRVLARCGSFTQYRRQIGASLRTCNAVVGPRHS